MTIGAPPNSNRGPTQGIAGGPPSTKPTSGPAAPGGGHAPVTPTTGRMEPSAQVAAPREPLDKKAGEATEEEDEQSE